MDSIASADAAGPVRHRLDDASLLSIIADLRARRMFPPIFYSGKDPEEAFPYRFFLDANESRDRHRALCLLIYEAEARRRKLPIPAPTGEEIPE